MDDQSKPPDNRTGWFVIDTLDARIPEFAAVSLPRPQKRLLRDSAELDNYSREFYELTMDLHPDWRVHAMLLMGDDSKGALFVEVPAPSNDEINLWLSTQDGQITVGFGEYYHTHFATYPPNKDAVVFARALQFVTDFLTEQMVLAVALSGTRTGASWTVRAEDELRFTELHGTLLSHDRIRLLSWHSTHDREIAV